MEKKGGEPTGTVTRFGPLGRKPARPPHRHRPRHHAAAAATPSASVRTGAHLSCARTPGTNGVRLGGLGLMQVLAQGQTASVGWRIFHSTQPAAPRIHAARSGPR